MIPSLDRGIKEKMVLIEDLTKLSVVRLKAFLKERNIPANGTKSELLLWHFISQGS
jgi:hypothetical protein